MTNIDTKLAKVNAHSRFPAIYRAAAREALFNDNSSNAIGSCDSGVKAGSEKAEELDTDLGGWDAAMMILFQMFGISKDVILHGDYETYIMKQQIMAMLEELMGEQLYSGTDKQEALEDFQTLLKYFKDYGKDLYDFLNKHRDSAGNLLLDGRTIPARRYRQFLKELDSAGDILEYGDNALEIFAMLLTDYSVGLDALDALERNFDGNEKMEAALAEIRALYEKEFAAYMDEVGALIAEIGIDKTIEALADTPVMAVVLAIEKAIDTVGELTGLSEKAKSMYDALTHFNMSSDTEAAFRRAVEKLQQADPNSEEYEKLAEDLNYCFELHKKNLKGMYDSMAKATDGTESSYYRYVADRVDKLTLGDAQEPNLLSYDEYLKHYNK